MVFDFTSCSVCPWISIFLCSQTDLLNIQRFRTNCFPHWSAFDVVDIALGSVCLYAAVQYLLHFPWRKGSQPMSLVWSVKAFANNTSKVPIFPMVGAFISEEFCSLILNHCCIPLRMAFIMPGGVLPFISHAWTSWRAPVQWRMHFADGHKNTWATVSFELQNLKHLNIFDFGYWFSKVHLLACRYPPVRIELERALLLGSWSSLSDPWWHLSNCYPFGALHT